MNEHSSNLILGEPVGTHILAFAQALVLLRVTERPQIGEAVFSGTGMVFATSYGVGGTETGS